MPTRRRLPGAGATSSPTEPASGVVALAALTPSRPLGSGLVGFVLLALATKAIGHLTLEVVGLLKRLERLDV